MNAMQLYPQEIHIKFLLNHMETILIKQKENNKHRVSNISSDILSDGSSNPIP